jgi:hypothetical protein
LLNKSTVILEHPPQDYTQEKIFCKELLER